jgi:hypothetical protein
VRVKERVKRKSSGVGTLYKIVSRATLNSSKESFHTGLCLAGDKFPYSGTPITLFNTSILLPHGQDGLSQACQGFEIILLILSCLRRNNKKCQENELDDFHTRYSATENPNSCILMTLPNLTWLITKYLDRLK